MFFFIECPLPISNKKKKNLTLFYFYTYPTQQKLIPTMEWPKFKTVHNLQTEKIYILENFNDVKNSIKQVIFNKDDTQSPYTKTYHENLTNGTFVLFNILDFERSVKLVLQYFTLCAFYVSVNTILNSRICSDH